MGSTTRLPCLTQTASHVWRRRSKIVEHRYRRDDDQVNSSPFDVHDVPKQGIDDEKTYTSVMFRNHGSLEEISEGGRLGQG